MAVGAQNALARLVLVLKTCGKQQQIREGSACPIAMSTGTPSFVGGAELAMNGTLFLIAFDKEHGVLVVEQRGVNDGERLE